MTQTAPRTLPGADPQAMSNPRFLARMVLLSLGLAGLAAAQVSPARRAELSASAAKELRGDILPFWLRYSRNPADGGFQGQVLADMKAVADSPRGALLTSRVLWTFSKAYRIYRDPAYLEMARYAYRDLIDHFVDRQDGGLFWSISAAGEPVDTHKQVYGQVFGLYALAEYSRATGDREALDEAIAIYRRVEAHARDRVHGGYFDSLDRNWARQQEPLNLLGNAPKSQNSHIHILEAYTELLKLWPDPGLRADQRALIDVTLRHLVNPRTHHLVLFMRDDWTPISDAVSYGHDIELSWLLVEAAQAVGDPALVAEPSNRSRSKSRG